MDWFGSSSRLIKREENPDAPATPGKYSLVNEPACEVTFVSRLAASQPKPLVQAPVGCWRPNAVRKRFTYVFVTVSLVKGRLRCKAGRQVNKYISLCLRRQPTL